MEVLSQTGKLTPSILLVLVFVALLLPCLFYVEGFAVSDATARLTSHLLPRHLVKAAVCVSAVALRKPLVRMARGRTWTGAAGGDLRLAVLLFGFATLVSAFVGVVFLASNVSMVLISLGSWRRRGFYGS